MSLKLPIALVAICNDRHEEMRDAIERTLTQIDPDQIIIYTDDYQKISIRESEYHKFYGDYIGAMRCLWYEASHQVRARHLLWIQPDSWVLDAARWTDEFLKYDYIGAPWPVEPGNTWDRLGYTRGRNVGNGGFSLRSRDLMLHLADRPTEYLMWLPEDDAICRIHRPKLEVAGFRWAQPELAAQFSFECTAPPAEGTFGFHGGMHAQRLRNE